MEEINQNQPNPRRRKKTQLEIFKEAYLPTIILGIAAVLILVFVVGALARSAGLFGSNYGVVTPTEDPVVLQQEAEVQQLLAQAEKLAQNYEFEDAIAVLDSFTGDKSNFPDLVYKRSEYAQQASQMVPWGDPSQVVNLSFHGLIADPAKAFANASYGKSYNKNFVTTDEFKQILQQLHENGYVLVSLDDIFSCETDANGNTVCEAKTLKLPLGKKPFVLTQTMIAYYGYMIESNGFASRMLVDADGNFTCEMTDANGNIITGDFDLVPILESFIAEHPEFSYKGARAVLAVTGDEGLFGYRTNPKVKEEKGEDYFNQQVEGAKALVNALRERGYELGCYTYGNQEYGKISAQAIQSDLNLWKAEVTPILGETNILVFARNNDIGSYSGSKFTLLQNSGFRYYLDFGTGRSHAEIGSNYISFQRLLVTGTAMAHSATSFTGMFDASEILDNQRGSVPS